MNTTRLLLSICALALLASCAAERERRARTRRHHPRDVDVARAEASDRELPDVRDVRDVRRTRGAADGLAGPPRPVEEQDELRATEPERRAGRADAFERRAGVRDASAPLDPGIPVPQNVDPRILKHRTTEVAVDPVSGVFFDPQLVAKVLVFYASPPSVFQESDGRPYVLPLNASLVATEPNPPDYAMTVKAGAIEVTEVAPPHRSGMLLLEDKTGSGVHYVDELLGQWQLATDTLIWVECHRPAPGDPPKKRLWTVETEALKKLLPPTDVTVAAGGIR